MKDGTLGLRRRKGMAGKLEQLKVDKDGNIHSVDSEIKKNKKTADKIINKSSQKNTTENLIPGTPEHKTQRWKDYEVNKGDNSNWTYDRWSKQYDTNMKNIKTGLGREAKYRATFGGKSAMRKTPYTYRQIDIFKEDKWYMGQLKTGKLYFTDQVKNRDLPKDAYFVQQGYTVEYFLENGDLTNTEFCLVRMKNLDFLYFVKKRE